MSNYAMVVVVQLLMPAGAPVSVKRLLIFCLQSGYLKGKDFKNIPYFAYFSGNYWFEIVVGSQT